MTRRSAWHMIDMIIFEFVVVGIAIKRIPPSRASTIGDTFVPSFVPSATIVIWGHITQPRIIWPGPAGFFRSLVLETRFKGSIVGYPITIRLTGHCTFPTKRSHRGKTGNSTLEPTIDRLIFFYRTVVVVVWVVDVRLFGSTLSTLRAASYTTTITTTHSNVIDRISRKHRIRRAFIISTL